MAATLKYLTEQENRDVHKADALPVMSGMSEWVVEGLDIESLQYVPLVLKEH